MLNVVYFPLIILFSIFFFGFSELLVINEEILLLLCFVAFFFNMYIFFGLSFFESFKGISDSIKLNFFNNFQNTKDAALSASKNFYFAEKKSLLFRAIFKYNIMICCKSLLKQDIIEEFLVLFHSFMDFKLVLWPKESCGRAARDSRRWVQPSRRGPQLWRGR